MRERKHKKPAANANLQESLFNDLETLETETAEDLKQHAGGANKASSISSLISGLGHDIKGEVALQNAQSSETTALVDRALGLNQAAVGNFAAAEANFHTAASEFVKGDDFEAAGQAYNAMGQGFTINGEFKEGGDAFADAGHQFEKAGDTTSSQSNYMQAGQDYLQDAGHAVPNHNIQSAEADYLAAASAFAKAGNNAADQDILQGSADMAKASKMAQEHDNPLTAHYAQEAAKLFEKAEVDFVKNEDWQDAALMEDQRGAANLSAHNFEEAQNDYYTAAYLDEKATNTAGANLEVQREKLASEEGSTHVPALNPSQLDGGNPNHDE